MTDKIRLFVERIRTSYWFVPTGMLFMGGGLAYLMTWMDRLFLQLELPWLAWLFTGGSRGAQGLLSAIASSVLGVAGTTFTITIAVLTLTSQQFGPRLLQSFLKDTRNQVVLGTFIGTFLYALLVMAVVRGVEESLFVPRLAVAMALILAVINAFVLVYFIQHIVSSIQVSHIVAKAGDEMLDTIERMCPEPDEDDDAPVSEGDGQGRGPGATFGTHTSESARVLSGKDGHLQAVDIDRLVRRAQEADASIDLVRMPGEYVPKGTVLALVSPADTTSDELEISINRSVTLGLNPTTTQDVAYAPSQLAEIAVRALSQGVNDPGTAIMCLDRLASGLVLLAVRDMPATLHRDEGGKERLRTKRPSFGRVLEISLSQIRRYGAGDVEVLSRILRLLVDVGEATTHPSRRETVAMHARLVLEQARAELSGTDACERLEAEFEVFSKRMEDAAGPGAI